MAKNLKFKHLLQPTFERIQKIKIQGATNVALAVAKALRKFSREIDVSTRRVFIEQVTLAGKYLTSARLTEPMADNVVEFVLYQLKRNRTQTISELRAVVKDAINYFFELVEQNEAKIIRFGEKLINFGDQIFTHCHSSTVMKILITAKRNKKRFEVFQTETRPLYQGHRTAKELIKNRIKDTLIVDSAAPYLLSKISGPQFSIDKVIIGCDAISQDGSCVNKVGSFGVALTAYLNRIPVYIATQSLKINEDAKNLKAIKLEQRLAQEVWSGSPKKLKIYNPAFDKIPSELITGYICEFGVIRPTTMIKKVREHYPWLF